MMGMWKAWRAAFAPLLIITALGSVAPADAAETQGKPLLEQRAAALQQLHDQRRGLLLEMAADPTLAAYLKATPEDAKKLAFAHKMQPHALGAELCLIDKFGHERMRMVNGRITADWELAHDEADAPFFAVTFAHPVGKALISAPYLSPDAGEWVTAYTTQVAGGEAILHFEHSLFKDTQQTVGGVGPAERQFLIAVLASTGEIVMDSRNASEPAVAFAQAGSAFDATLASALRSGQSGTMRTQIGGQPWTVIYKPVETTTLALFERQGK